MRTIDVPAAEGEESNGGFIDRVGRELERILADRHSGQLVLRSDHRQALEETGRCLDQLRPAASPPDQARIDDLRARVDLILGSQADASAAIATFLAPIRAQAAPRAPVPPAPASERRDVPAVRAVPPPEPPAPAAPARWTPPPEPAWRAAPPPAAAPPEPALRVASPPPPAPAGDRRGRWLAPLGVAAAVLLVATAALGWLSLHNYDATSKWRTLDAEQAAMTGRVTAQLETANGNIATLNSQVRALNTQVSSAQGRLSTVANQKEVAIDQQTVLKQFAGVAATVAAALQECVTYSGRLQTDLNSAIASKDPAAIAAIQPESAQVAALCGRAETANQALQAAIQGGA